MRKRFNITGRCVQSRHYMVNIDDRLFKIKTMIENGDYFVMNRARQYGKTTTLGCLSSYLESEYIVISMDFQLMSDNKFCDEHSFSIAFADYLLEIVRNDKVPVRGLDSNVLQRLHAEVEMNDYNYGLVELFRSLSSLCRTAEKPVVLIIDEVDTASNYQVFLGFLAQLRGYYLKREINATFQSVILAGVYNIKNLKSKLRPESEHRFNSPWNIAADFRLDMSFSAADIKGMLCEYEADYMTGMDIEMVAGIIYDYTSGYPVLVSDICKRIDEEIPEMDSFSDKASAWTRKGVLEAVNCLISEKNMLFDSLTDKVENYPDLKNFLYSLLMTGKEIAYNPDIEAIDVALMFGFVKVENTKVVVANRIFETRLYNMFLTSPEMQKSRMYTIGTRDKYQFVKSDGLDMDLILERFVTSFDDLYGDRPQSFLEEDGRRYFLLYLRPIINGMGNYYIESRTRNMERTDVIVDYGGKQYVIELKIWRGNAYNSRGEKQLMEYLDYYHLDCGYMLSFNFNKKKEIGLKRICLGDKVLVEAVV
ncbi:MAG: ATP-binding protein [Lachnospiraceae bacterium]|nr:ATP-binding protein [Lachnospiraceae bacterium]